MAEDRLVDYERTAERYDRGRSLEPSTESRWRETVRRLLPAGSPRQVVDVQLNREIFRSAASKNGVSPSAVPSCA